MTGPMAPAATKLHGKFMMQAISTGGPEHFYKPQGKNRFEIRELLNPFNQTAYLCGMAYLEPFAIFVGRRIPNGRSQPAGRKIPRSDRRLA